VRGVLCALVLCGAPAVAHGQRAAFEEIQTFSAVMNLIRLNHVDSVNYTPLVRAAIEGALAAADPHSRYVRRDIEARLIAARSGEGGTAGVDLDALRNVVTIVAVGSASPGEAAGLLPGDRIVAVEDSSVAGLAAHEVELLLSGEPRTERRLTVERGDPLSARRVDVTVRLDRWTWPNIATPLLLRDDIGYVKLGGFDTRAAAELERALDNLRRQGMQRLVLDLRGNPGGLLSEAVSVAALFLPRDAVVMQTKGRKADTNSELRTRTTGRYQQVPMVVLVDGSSASAAEALAGALQDHRRALIAGHRTFGKALVQAPFPLPAGDILWLTISRVHTPDGRMIQRSYDGLSAGQYAAAAESLRRGGPDAAAGGSGGIEPDSYFAARPEPPPWWATMRQRGLDLTSVQRADLSSSDDPAAWREPLMRSLQTVLIETLGSVAPVSDEQQSAATRHLSYVAIRVRDGEGAAAEFAVRNDPEVLRATALLDERPAVR
jgi:C-terminal peptidase prc